MRLSERAGKWVVAAFVTAALACDPVPNADSFHHSGFGGGGAGGGGAGEGGAGGESIGGTGGGAGLGEGGTGGDAGDDEWAGPVGYVEVGLDFPQVYGDMAFRVGKRELPLETPGDEGCAGDGEYVVSAPEGRRDIVAEAARGFRWRFSADVLGGDCVRAELVADESVSSFWAFGIVDSGIGLTRRMFPVVFTVDEVVQGEVSEFFVWADLYEKDPSRPKTAFLEEVLRGRLFVFPVNEEDEFPRILRIEGQKGSFIGSGFSGRREFHEKGPDWEIETIE